MSIKQVPAILREHNGERHTVHGVKFNEQTQQLPGVLQYKGYDFSLSHHPGANTGPLNPPTYDEAHSQSV
jgi:hypothetical protein